MVAAQPDESTEPADEIYVDGDGNSVLVYEEDAENSEVEFGADVGAGLLHALVVSDAEVDETDVTGSGTAVLTDDQFTGNGTFAAPRPDELADLSVDVDGVHDDEESRFDATAHARIEQDDRRGGLPVDEGTAEGTATVTASTFQATADVDATLAEPLGDDRRHAFTVTESDGTYTLEADESYVVSEFAADQWATRERAEATLRDRYGSLAEEFDGTSEVVLESYSYTETADGRYRLDVQYTVTYHDVEAGLTRELTETLARSDEVDLDERELDDLEGRLGELTLEEVHASYEQQGTDVTASFRMHVENYDQVVHAGLDVVEAADTGEVELDEDVQHARDVLDAQAAADLERRYTVRVDVASVDGSAVAFDLESTYRTENWQAYLAELEDRGIERTDVSYEIQAESRGEEIETTAAVEVRQDDLVDGATDALLGVANEEDAEAEAYVRAFREAGFERARVDVSLTEGTVRFEGATAFENMTALQSALAENEQLPAFESAVARTDNGTVRTYVRVPGATSPDADEDAVRELSYVDANTEVHLAGTWNRTFPEADTESAREYLGLTPTPEPGDDGGVMADGAGPGIGAAIAAFLTTVALLARRRT